MEEDITTELFVNKDKTPMVFCLRPCSIKQAVKKEIVKGSGLCFPNMIKVPGEYRDKAITLLPDGEVSWNINTISARYILDCAKEGKLLPRERYSCAPVWQKADSDSARKGRMEYTKEEDINILLYVRDNAEKDKMSITGNSFWKKLEKLNMLQLNGRSWHSLRDRYLKHLKGREHEYHLDGREMGPLPMPPKEKSPKAKPPLEVPDQVSTSKTENVPDSNEKPGFFLMQVEATRDRLSPNLTRKGYDELIDTFATKMQKKTKLDSKSIHKVLYKCNGDQCVAEHFLTNGECPPGYHLFTDEEDEVLLKCLLNPTICDETPAKRLAADLGEEPVLKRAAALLGVSRSDFQYMKNIPLKSMATISETSSD